MRVAIINSVNKIRSTGRISFELGEYLKANGLESCVFYGRYNNSEGRYFGSKIDFFFHSVFSRVFGRHASYSKMRTNKLIKDLKAYQPDVFVVNNLHGYYINFKKIMSYIASTGKKTIFIFHDSWNLTGHCSNFSYIKCNEWQNGCRKCLHKRLYPISWFSDNTKLNFRIKEECFSKISNKIIVCPSSWLAELVRDSYLKSSSIKTIHNGIDIDRFSKRDNQFRTKYNLQNKRIILSIAYFFGEKKGIFDIIKLSKLIDENTVIITVGILAKNISLPNNVINIQKTDNFDDLIDIYSSADVFLNTTYEDNYPTVNLEALSCSLPVVSYMTGGSCELIDPRFAVPVGDVDAAYNLISQILDKKIDYVFPNKKELSNVECFKSYLRLIIGDENE